MYAHDPMMFPLVGPFSGCVHTRFTRGENFSVKINSIRDGPVNST